VTLSVYYNEIEPYAAAWLKNLMDAGYIPTGDIDTRSIEDVRPDDLRGYTQCHFFAGIGGWAYALALAGWPSDRPVWTGSCPCQPFSAAGKGPGFEDERHLWPSWQHLIAQCRPPVIFGEQVASAAAAPWIDLVQADVEGMDYAYGCVPFPAAGIGAPHIRDRNYWVADSDHSGLEGWGGMRQCSTERPAGTRSLVGRLAYTNGRNACAERQQRSGEQRQQSQDSGDGGMEHALQLGRQWGQATTPGHNNDRQASERAQGEYGARIAMPHRFPRTTSAVNGFWADADWLLCTDGKWRPVEPGTFPLAHGIPNRVGRLRAFGNAIVPQEAAEFIITYIEARGLSFGELAVAA